MSQRDYSLFAIVVCVLIFLSFPLYSYYYDVFVEEIPMYISGVDIAGDSFSTFFNIVNLNGSFNASDNTYLSFRLKDTYIGKDKDNKLYIDRLIFSHQAKEFSVSVGRMIFLEGRGMLIGNLADGVVSKFNLGGMQQRVLIYYSGLLPNDINRFNINSYDQANNAKRMSGAITCEAFQISLIRKLGVLVYYSKDISDNDYFNPFYVSLYGDSVLGNMSIGFEFVYEGGSLTDTTDISAFAGRIDVSMKISDIYVGAGLSYASGSSLTDYNRFDAFGVYDTGFVLVPDFSNIIIAKLNSTLIRMNNRLTIRLNYYYFRLANVNDRLDGYYDGDSNIVGHELSLYSSFKLDPNIMLFANTGIFFKGSAFADSDNVYKIIGGLKLKI